MAKAKEEKSKRDLPLIEKLFEIEHQLEFIKKDTKGHNYTYASPTAVLGRVKPLLREYGVKLEQHITRVEHERVFSKPNSKALPTTTPEGKTISMQKPFDVHETLVSLWYDMMWINVDNPEETRVVPFFAQGMNGDDKGVGSAMTYAERYFLLKYFNIATDNDDPDWLANQPEKQAPQPKPQPKTAVAMQQTAKKEQLEPHILQTMINYVKEGKSESVAKRLASYEYTQEQYTELIKAGMPPIQ
jgi:hypothetical protein